MPVALRLAYVAITIRGAFAAGNAFGQVSKWEISDDVRDERVRRVLDCMGRKRNSRRTLSSRDPRQHGQAGSRSAGQGTVPGVAIRRDNFSSLPQSERRNLGKVLAICGLLLLAVGLVFGQTVGYDFVNYDDDVYVYKNPQIAHGLTFSGITWVFTHSHGANWHPLTGLSHMVDCQLDGLHAGGHHLTNVLLHAATAIVLFLVLRRMTGGFWPSALVAALFAVHPLRVESVAWISERKDVLSGLFFVLTLGAYVRYVRGPFSLGRYLLVAVLLTLGLMAKPMLVTLPLVLLLLDYWPLGRMTAGAWEDISVARGGRTDHFFFPQRLLLEKLPLLLLAVTSCLMTLWAQARASALNEQIPLGSRIANALVSYVAYLGQLFCPVGLAAHYPHPEGDLPVWEVMGALVVLACISAGVLAWRRRYPYVLVGWLWYVGMLVPVIGLVQVGKIAMADRYTYLPQIGLGIALAWGAIDVCRSWPYRRWLCGVTSGLVLAALTGCAWRQTSFWRDSETLWNHALACTSQAFVVHTNLGHALANQGRMDEAMAHYQKALEIQPNYVEAHNNLGYAFACLDRFDEAMAQYQEAVEIQPDCVEARYNLGNALARLDRFDEAITQYRKALDVRPDYAEAHNNLGYALANRGRMDEAMAQYRKALEIQPDYADAYYNLGDVSAARSLFDEAIRHYRKALDLATRHNNQPLEDAARAKIEEYEAGKALPQPRPTSVRPPSP